MRIVLTMIIAVAIFWGMITLNGCSDVNNITNPVEIRYINNNDLVPLYLSSNCGDINTEIKSNKSTVFKGNIYNNIKYKFYVCKNDSVHISMWNNVKLDVLPVDTLDILFGRDSTGMWKYTVSKYVP